MSLADCSCLYSLRISFRQESYSLIGNHSQPVWILWYVYVCHLLGVLLSVLLSVHVFLLCVFLVRVERNSKVSSL